MTMMDNLDYKHINMLASFRTVDLQRLLSAFGRSVEGRKSELKDRAFELLRTRSPGFNQAEYVSKIDEIYRSLQPTYYNNSIIINNSLIQTQQRPMRGQIQAQQQRIYKPVPQYPQQPMRMTRGRLPQVMPQIQRGIYSNSVRANTMANNNIQCISGSYQPSGPRCITSSHLSSSQQINVASRDPLGYNMQGMTVENNSYTPSAEAVAKIEFKNIPFYEVMDVVLEPTFLAGTDKCTLEDPPIGMKESQFKYLMSIKAVNSVATTRAVFQEKNDYPIQYQIRIGRFVESLIEEVTDCMPLGLHIRVNDMICQLPPMPPTRQGAEYRRAPTPINCTKLVKLSPINHNIIKINWTDTEKYVMAMYVVRIVSSETLIQELIKNGGRSSEQTKNQIIEKLAVVDPDLATTSYRFSLVCPLGKMRMEIPAKSIHCDHLQCFDARTFILMNEKKPTWKCPTCSKPCLYDDIQIENYFLEVVSNPILKDCNNEIEFLGDGTWQVAKESKTTNRTFGAKLNPIKVENNTETVKHQENEKLKLVDLTLSDTEEEPVL